MIWFYYFYQIRICVSVLSKITFFISFFQGNSTEVSFFNRLNFAAWLGSPHDDPAWRTIIAESSHAIFHTSQKGISQYDAPTMTQLESGGASKQTVTRQPHRDVTRDVSPIPNTRVIYRQVSFGSRYCKTSAERCTRVQVIVLVHIFYIFLLLYLIV